MFTYIYVNINILKVLLVSAKYLVCPRPIFHPYAICSGAQGCPSTGSSHPQTLSCVQPRGDSGRRQETVRKKSKVFTLPVAFLQGRRLVVLGSSPGGVSSCWEANSMITAIAATLSRSQEPSLSLALRPRS